eukprot:TRINITY_DN15_c0_g1_i2.p1 TRINITY_DN15_c0_g1~~TRINITY_DN15_c0_g1_i2.p1  ORF type:complete len:162 (+),score=88.47 TRINITY_DN15_c0_g1_i2:45-530(+)
MSASRYAQQEAENNQRAKQWLSNLLGVDVEDDLFSALADGVLLCSIVNTIKPNTIPKVNPTGRCKKFVAKKMENINNFIMGARRIGVLTSYLFDPQEFVQKRRPDKLVNCLLKLEEIAKRNGINAETQSEALSQIQNQIEEQEQARLAAIAAEVKYNIIII